jgi:exodeoxyribonuclease V alpha subunit
MRGEHEPLDVDMLIIDEASMLDQILIYNVMKALPPEAHLLLVGDVDQLPSVGAGDVLRDLINGNIAHVTRLEAIFRQSGDSQIIPNAHRINQGEMPQLDNASSDFFMFYAETPEAAADLVVEIVQKRIPSKFGFDPMTEIQVLSPMYRGAVGIQMLNERLQAALNPQRNRAEKKLGNTVYRVGDKVLQTRNNYDKEVFNGDIGIIQAIDFTAQKLRVAFDDRVVEYDWDEASDLLHAYAVSVHRSQGSEYPAVVMPIVPQHYMLLQRNLLYTAVTRARHLVVLVGMKRAVAMAVNNDQVARRYTALAWRLQTKTL